MNDYISRKALLDWVHEFYPEDKVFASAIINAPASDVAPVRHGEWEIVVGSNGKEYMVCTCCRVSQDLTGVFTYCPNCGAKMDGDDVV